MNKLYTTIYHSAKVIKQFKNYLYYFGVLLIILFYIFLSLPSISFLKKINFFAVKSGSMSPTFKKNSLLLVKKLDEYQIGDIITYYPYSFTNSTETITHRIQKKVEKDNLIYYQTKGDASTAVDPNLVPGHRIVGKVIKFFPNLGWFNNVMSKNSWVKLCFGLPGMAVIFVELKKIITYMETSQQ
jgi:signal peptidase I